MLTNIGFALWHCAIQNTFFGIQSSLTIVLFKDNCDLSFFTVQSFKTNITLLSLHYVYS